jgi:hypothetical protein
MGSACMDADSHESDYACEGTPIITVKDLGELGVTPRNLRLL